MIDTANTSPHSFHIPVMGIAFTIDTPIKVAHYGISSVMSLVDDELIEQMREHHSKENDLQYEPISKKEEDFRAKRITAYLDLVDYLVKSNFKRVQSTEFEEGSEITKYFEMLSEKEPLRIAYEKMLALPEGEAKTLMQKGLRESMRPGSIDVNIMTKLDRVTYAKKDALPIEFNEAHSALRGYANSNLDSSIIFSAGMNPRLYSYISQFDDFYPNENGYIKKRIVLKVSDYRSSLIQGKFLAKKGLWVSEYRIESGLNCGGHAFASDGFLMGPILDQFRVSRSALIESVHAILIDYLSKNNKNVPAAPLPMKVTAQGGVGTSEEHDFLIDHYGMDSVGWGTPFLLVPEAVTLDEPTRQQLVKAKEEDLYLSNISPLGIPFNSLRGNTKDVEKQEKIDQGRPGSSCPLNYLVSSKEFTERAICTASRQYQRHKLKALEALNLAKEEYKKQFDKITDKSCICVGLGTSAVKVNNLENKVRGEGISVCPGPNMAYFDEVISLKKMANHIYGKINILSDAYRPNMFVKEIGLYIDYLENKIKDVSGPMDKQMKYFNTFQSNMEEGLAYYKDLFTNVMKNSESMKQKISAEIDEMEAKLSLLKAELALVVA
ncbi:hypothetical protein KFE94_09460 [bacterium SCSIO 12643]|nr:hypothetical protein KFE94_09460 [bacterium SCSIO 12643]